MTETPAIEVKNLKVIYNENTPNEIVALNSFSLKVKRGEVLVVTGGNGTGKSTLLNAIAGTIPIQSGHILFNGNDITDWSTAQRAKIMGIVYQDTMLGTCPNLSLHENFQLTNIHKWWLPIPYKLIMSKNQINSIQKIGLGLESRMATKINMLSGGQRQAIAVCLAFENDKPILLFDEFTSALDEPTMLNLMNYTISQSIQYHTTVIIVMHNTERVEGLCNNILRL